MEGESAAIGTALDNGTGAIFGQVLWQEMCLLGYERMLVCIILDPMADLSLRLGQIHGVEVPSQC
jgi:hypothetical protein